MERPAGIEPSSAWKAEVMPLYDDREMVPLGKVTAEILMVYEPLRPTM